MWVARWAATSRLETLRYAECRIDGPGWGPAVLDAATGVWVPCGHRAAGFPWLAMLPRRHEITAGVIPHAIPIALPTNRMLYRPSHWGESSGEHTIGEGSRPDGLSVGADGVTRGGGYGNQQGYVAPATEQDWDARWVYKGPIPMGQRFVIPKSTNLASLGLNPAALMLAKAAQDYGVIVCDTTGGGDLWATFYAEAGVPSSWTEQAYANRQLATIRRALVAVN
jgi:hypothetical protein